MGLKELKNYPDVDFIENKSIDEMKTDFLRDMKEEYRRITGNELILHDADPVKLVSEACCLQLYQIAQYANRAGKVALLKYSFGEYLENIGALKGIRRIEGSAARTRLRFTLSMKRNNATVIPPGTRVTASDGVYFETAELLEIPAGEMIGETGAVCKEMGSKGNGYVPGMLRTMVDPVAYVDNVENIVETEGGADRESDENLAERIYLAPSSWSVAGPDDAYKYWVKTYDVAITDVRVFSPEPGIVEIYFLMQDGELPDQAIIDGVESFLRKEDVRPLTDLVMVKQPEERHYQIDATYYINESDRNRAAVIVKQVDAAVLEYIKWQRQKIGRDINPDELRKVMVMAGAKRVQVRSPTFEKIPRNCVAVLDGEAQVIYGGVEDD